MADRVVPNSLNYTDIKPESIESEIKLVKFQPTATITGARGGDMVKFLLSGNGFFDPYSAYFSFVVECSDLQATEYRTLDRSAHSFISRMVIRSQGVELERIENYDVVAAMINDMIYSPEQNAIHSWEGFPTQQVPQHTYTNTDGVLYNPSSQVNLGANAVAVGEASYFPVRNQISQLLNQGSSPMVNRYCGEVAFYNGEAPVNILQRAAIAQAQIGPAIPAANVAASVNYPLDSPYVVDTTFTANNPLGNNPNSALFHNTIPVDFAYHQSGFRYAGVQSTDAANANFTSRGSNKYRFIIPIYSGVLGLLMPDKKLLPLNLLPLDIEITFNNSALYTNLPNGSRAYTITEFNMYAHMIFFEQDIHRSLEAAVAEHGIFIYCNSFHSAPQTLIANQTMPTVTYISMNLKSINSVHTIFMYNFYETMASARKLHFVSHNLTSLQLLNGTQLIPQYAIEGNAGTSLDNSHVPFIVELMKAWNKMHDPKTDGAIMPYNYCGDELSLSADALGAVPWGLTYHYINQYHTKMLVKQGQVGRCQYGISLEGEELGSDKTMITGRKSQYPFLLQLKSSGKVSTKTSYMLTFLRADFIVYIRPDLQIVTLGK